MLFWPWAWSSWNRSAGFYPCFSQARHWMIILAIFCLALLALVYGSAGFNYARHRMFLVTVDCMPILWPSQPVGVQDPFHTTTKLVFVRKTTGGTTINSPYANTDCWCWCRLWKSSWPTWGGRMSEKSWRPRRRNRKSISARSWRIFWSSSRWNS